MKLAPEKRVLVAIGAMLSMWASAFAGIRFSLLTFSPGELTLLRFLIASAAFGVIAVSCRLPKPRRKDLPMIALLGFFGITFYHLALNYGEKTITAGAASLLVSSAPVFTTLLAAVILKEKPSLIGWLGTTIGLLGVAIITLGEGGNLGLEPRAWVVLLASISSSLYTVIQKQYVMRYPPMVFSAYTVWTGTVPLLIFMPALLETLRAAPAAAIGTVVYLGIFPGCIAYILWVYCLRHVPASRLSSILYLNPVLAVFIAWLLLRETPGWLSLIGGAITIFGVALSNIGGRSGCSK